MSRIGKQPIPVPANVEVTTSGRTVRVKGPNGELSWETPPQVTASYDGAGRVLSVGRSGDDRDSRALHGLSRALLANMVAGATTLFEKRLEIQGVGYNATLAGKVLQLQVGYANVVKLPVPDGVKCEVPDQTHIVLKSMDKQAVGQFAANIRGVRPPEPYKGKGIRYQGEQVRRKVGKALAK